MFPLFQKRAKILGNSLFLLKLVFKEGESGRFCFSVSKKVAKKAVLRNKLRRAGYKILRKYLENIKSKTLAIFYFKKVPKNNEEMEKELFNILKSSKLIS